MKKSLKILLFLLLILPFAIFASVKVGYDDAMWSCNTYITQFKNYRWFIDFNVQRKYLYNGSSFSEVSGFNMGGLVSLNEYKISLLNNESYLKTPRAYWTMTFSANDVYMLNNGKENLMKDKSTLYGVRPTEYVLSKTEVTGDGSYSNPWTFVKPEFYVEIEYNSPQIYRDNTLVLDTTAEYGDRIIYNLNLKNNGVRDSKVNVREVALISAINNGVVELDSSSIKINGEVNSVAKSAVNDLLSTSGYTFTIEQGKTVNIEFSITIVGNAGDVVNNQLLYTIDGIEAEPGVKNSVAIEKVVQYNEVSENGINLVLALDNSGSMSGDKMSSLKTSTNNLLNLILGENTNSNNEVCIVIMPNDKNVDVSNIASLCSKNKSDLSTFATNNLDSSGSYTPFSNTFNKTYILLNELKNKNKMNSNFALFLSDGLPENDNNYTTYANNIKSVGELYTIGFQTTTEQSNTLKSLATSSSHYYDASSSDINSIFTNIAKKISERTKKTNKGVISISSDIDKTKNIIFEITDKSNNTSKITKTYDEALNESYIIFKSSKYVVNIKKFKATDKVSVTYYVEKS